MEIRLSCRQSGKSTEIALLMEKYPDSICIQPNEQQKQFFCRNFKIDPKRVFTVFNIQNDHRLQTDGSDKRKIFVDELGFCFQMFMQRVRGNVVYGTHTNLAFNRNPEFKTEYEAHFIGDLDGI